jgi:hypothetical protein
MTAGTLKNVSVNLMILENLLIIQNLMRICVM